MSRLWRTLFLACGMVAESYSLSAAGLSAVVVSPISQIEGALFNGPIGGFSDNASEPVSNFSATINWGDGTASTGTIVSNGGGTFIISGAHTYPDGGATPFTTSINLTDSDGDLSLGIGSANVADAALTPLTHLPSFSFAAGLPVNVSFGSFSDGNPFAAPSEFIATINWGDGSLSAGTIAAVGNGFSVSGTHTYPQAADFIATVDVADDGGAQVDFRSEALGAATVPEPAPPGMILAGLGSIGALAWRGRMRRS